MSSDLEKRIRERAYEIWESEGRPHGRHSDHWEQAHGEFATAKTESETPRKRGRARASTDDAAAPAAADKPKAGASRAKSSAASKTREAKPATTGRRTRKAD
ncbi:MAG: DUF2934 domain-containing protein [Sphingomonas sp.]